MKTEAGDFLTSIKNLRQRYIDYYLKNNLALKNALKIKLKPYKGPSFADALRKTNGLKVIAEIKQSSPSKGHISEINWEKIKQHYAKADAISVLTEPVFFSGDFSYITKAYELLKKPILAKDFFISYIQIEIARLFGAAAILIIDELLDFSETKKLIKKCTHLNMDVLFEVRSSEGLKRAEKAKAKIVGINARNLKTLRINFKEIKPLVKAASNNFEIVVLESGVKSSRDIVEFVDYIDAVLIGTALMKSKNPGRLIDSIKELASVG